MSLTTQSDVLKQAGQAGAQIEITAAMIEAGVAAWHDWDQTDDCWPENLVKTVFRAMILGQYGRSDREKLSVRTTPETFVMPSLEDSPR